MRIKVLILLGMLAVIFNSRADIFVYKMKVTITTRGNGQIVKQPYTGNVVFDAATASYTYIYVDSNRKTFFTYIPAFSDFTVVISTGGTHFRAIFEDAPNAGTFILKGTESILSTSTATNWAFPPTFKISGSNGYTSNNNPYYEEDLGTLIFDAKNTGWRNAIGQTQDTAVSNITSNLVSQGYTQQN